MMTLVDKLSLGGETQIEISRFEFLRSLAEASIF